MASILSTLATSLLSGGATQSLASSTGASNDQMQNLISAALPMLLNGMASNASSQDGAASLATALDSHASKGNTLESVLQNVDLEDGAKVLGHLLGGDTGTAQNDLAKSTGLSAEQVSSALATLAPVVMNLVGREKQKSSAGGSGDLMSMLTGLVTGTSTTPAATTTAKATKTDSKTSTKTGSKTTAKTGTKTTAKTGSKTTKTTKTTKAASKTVSTKGSGIDLGDVIDFALKDNDGDGKSDLLTGLAKLMGGK